MKSKNGKQLLLSVYNHCFQMSLLCLLLLVTMAPFLLKNKQFSASLKGDSHNIPALAISKDPGNGMRMDLAFPRRTEQICYSKCQLIYSRKLQRFQTVPIPEFPCQHPWFYSCASCVLLSALLQHVAPQ